jgi:hypothetical protein
MELLSARQSSLAIIVIYWELNLRAVESTLDLSFVAAYIECFFLINFLDNLWLRQRFFVSLIIFRDSRSRSIVLGFVSAVSIRELS